MIAPEQRDGAADQDDRGEQAQQRRCRRTGDGLLLIGIG